MSHVKLWIKKRLEFKDEKQGQHDRSLIEFVKKVLNEEEKLNGIITIDISAIDSIHNYASYLEFMEANKGSRFVFFPLLCKRTRFFEYMAMLNVMTAGRLVVNGQMAARDIPVTFLESIGINTPGNTFNFINMERIMVEASTTRMFREIISDRFLECSVCMEPHFDGINYKEPANICDTCTSCYCAKCEKKLKKTQGRRKVIQCVYCKKPLQNQMKN